MNLHSNPLESECVTVPRGRGRPKVLSDVDRRSALVASATRIFTELGYGRTTMEIVATRAHVSKQTLYRFFPSKPTLFAAVVDAHRQTMLALPGDYDDMPLDAALAAIFRTDVDEASYDERMLLFSVVSAEANQYPEVMDVIHAHGAEPARADLTAWMRHEIERGRLRGEDDPEALADVLLDMIFGASEAPRHRQRDGNEASSVSRARVLRAIRIFLGGVATR